METMHTSVRSTPTCAHAEHTPLCTRGARSPSHARSACREARAARRRVHARAFASAGRLVNLKGPKDAFQKLAGVAVNRIDKSPSFLCPSCTPHQHSRSLHRHPSGAAAAHALTMEGLAACSIGGGRRFLPLIPSPSSTSRRHYLSSRRGSSRISASRDGPELDKWDKMELKFGRLLGEDPKLTLAKIMAKKSNPDVSYLDVEKSFAKNKGKIDDNMARILEEMDAETRSPGPLTRPNPPVQKPSRLRSEGMALNLTRPVLNKGIRAAARPDVKQDSTDRSQLVENVDKAEAANVTLRKPSIARDEDSELGKNSKLKIKPNLTLKMRTGTIEEFRDVPLLKKPEVVKAVGPDVDIVSAGESVQSGSLEMRIPGVLDDSVAVESDQGNSLDITSTSGAMDVLNDRKEGSSDDSSVPVSKSSDLDVLNLELQLRTRISVESQEVLVSMEHVSQNTENDDDESSKKSSLLKKPPRLNSSSMENVSCRTGGMTVISNDEDHNFTTDVRKTISAEQEEREENDWKKAEHLFHTGGRDEVELLSCSGRGFVVSFGSLVGFLPYRNLGAKWKFLAFESWLRKNGLDPSMYRQKLSIMANYNAQNKNLSVDLNKDQEMSQNEEQVLPPTMKFKELLEAYEDEKTKFLSSFLSQRIRVSVVHAVRDSKKLLFSGRPKEKEEVVEKKRSLMAKLSVGDVVKCCIKKITYFGIFVEVEGVPALIHQSELSWDATLDPSSFFKIGQTVEAKVHQLDYALDRISLSLREITPDPLMEALESVVGERTSLGGSLEPAQADFEWPDVESLIKELLQTDGVHSVSKGRFFISTGLAPTFQVYMASMFNKQYKLLARFENKVQEVLVQASLDKEQMKAAILTCTNRVV